MKNFISTTLSLLLITLSWCQKIIEQEINDWEYRMMGDSIWKKAKVPGTIIDNFIDLYDLSNPLHPYYGDNEKLYQWIGERSWEFRTTVMLPVNQWNSDCAIEFGALDLFSDVYVNSQKYSGNNAFTPMYISGLQSNYKYGDGSLGKGIDIRIVFHSTIDSLKRLQALYPMQLPGGERVYGRTAQYQFGWDWGPKFVNMGIRKPVKLKLIPANYADIFKLSIRPNPDSKSTHSYSVLLDYYSSLDTLDWNFTVHLNGELIHSNKFTNNNARNEGQQVLLFHLMNPKLWWPNGLDEKPNVYTFRIQFYKVGSNEVVAEKILHHAFCDIQLVSEKDKVGESFYFKVNGERVFIKGANYIPDDSFHPGKNTTGLVQLAKDANMNMLRVWGGGNYPDDEFYIECMKNGLMVWQDYMFACAMYPGNADFLSNVSNEAYFQTTRLENFGNIALWCGNNENDEGWKNWGWQKEFNYTREDSSRIWMDYLNLNDTILRFANGRYKQNHSYIPTSPQYGWGRKESMTHGDSHYWGIWWGLEPIEKYKEKVPRFMSEFGMQAMPDFRLLQKVIPDSAMSFNSNLFKNHQKHPTGFQTVNHYLKQYFVIPNKMDEYIYATQVLQAYALQTAIESQRSRMPYCMGSLLWQLNDCWPVTSWSIVDYELNKKIGYDQVKKSFMPVIITLLESAKSYDLYIVNDGLKSHHDVLNVYVSDFSGNIHWEKSIRVNIKSLTSRKVVGIPKRCLKNPGIDKLYIHAELESDINTRKNFHLTRPNQLKLALPDISIFKDINNQYYLMSDTYCPYVWLPAYGKHAGTCFPDLEPNKPYAIYVTDKDVEWIQYLHQNVNRILCLNKLLHQ